MEKISREKKIAALMIKMYCRNRHKTASLCIDCAQLLNYAESRLSRCSLAANKPKCADCHIHCYALEMRDKIRAVMRFSGPRITFKHPILALFHALQ